MSRDRAEVDSGDHSAGFTLIELLVVMIIIGILAGIAIPVYLNQRNSGYDARAKSEMRIAVTAMITFQGDNGQFSNSDTVMRSLEPAVTWQTSYGANTNSPPIDSVSFEWAQGGTPSTTIMAIRSQSNRCFYARIIEDATTVLGAPGVTYLSEAGPCADPYDKSFQTTNRSY